MRISTFPKHIVLLLLTLCLGTIGFAQTTTPVTGIVSDNATSKSLEGVTVTVKGSRTSTSTNAKGSFIITVPANATLVFSYVGYANQEIRVQGSTNFDVKLSANTNTMDEVVVVGYGAKKRVNIQGAVSTIKAAEIEDLPVANLPSALVNRVPGVNVNFASGKPGSTTSINLRNSITFPGAPQGVSSQPLVVIDGIISNPAQWLQSPNADFLENIDASQIEDITFLKDASAAIYGAAGAKGVVLITTKRGKVGKPKVSYSGYFGVSTPTERPRTLTAYEHAKFLNDGFELNGRLLTERFSQADLDSLKGIEDKSWYDYFWKNGKVQRHTLTVSGGSDRVTFFAGGSYYNEKGNYGIVGTDKYSLRAGMNAKVIEGLTADVTFATDFNKEESNNHSSASTETDDATIRSLYLTPKWVPVTLGDKLVGFQGANNSSPQNGNWSFLGVQNSGSYRRSRSQGLAVNASMDWRPKFINGLAARVQFGKNNRSAIAKGYFASYNVANLQRRGQNSLLYSDQIVVPAAGAPVVPTLRVANNDQLQEGTTLSDNYQVFGTLSYGKKIGAHEFDVMVGFDQSESEGRNVLLTKNTQIVAGIDEFWAYSNDPTAIGSINEVVRPTQAFITAKRSYISRANYSLAGKYFVEFIGRADASVNFAPGNRWGFFPTVGLGWRVSDEKFFGALNLNKFINNLKLRATYGLVGEDRVGNRLYESRFTQTTGVLFGNTATSGLDPNVYPNPLITWEKARTLNVGFDATILNKINITAEFYQRYAYDGYDTYSASVFPPTTGIPPPVVNYGKQLSWGSEFAIGYRTKFGKDWGFNLDANFAITNSQLVQAYYNEALLGQFGNDQLGITVGRDPRRYNSSNIGYIATGILRTQADVDAVLAKNPNYLIGGVKPQVGFMNFQDINGDGQITEAGDATLMFDRTAPIVGFGFTIGFTYKTVRVSTNLNLSVGGKRLYDSDARIAPTIVRNAAAFWADHWSPENPNGKFPRADAPLATAQSTFWAVNGTQSRINNMVISYQIPKNLTSRIGIPDLRFLVTGTNLWSLINPLDYKDPYTSNFGSYPTLRTISLGINANL